MVKGRPSATRARPPLTAVALERAALNHLNRFDTTVAGLREVLRRMVRREMARKETAPGEGHEALASVEVERHHQSIEVLLQRYQESGLLSDRRFAEQLLDSQRRRGSSLRLIQAKMQRKGVSESVIREVMASESDPSNGQGDTELDAAGRYIKRRRLGSYRSQPILPEQRRRYRERDLAALARAGFSLDVARRALELDASARDDEM